MSDVVGKKKWWESTGVWGGVVAVLAGVAGFIGLDAVGVAADLDQVITGALSVVGGIVAIVGRFRARKQIES